MKTRFTTGRRFTAAALLASAALLTACGNHTGNDAGVAVTGTVQQSVTSTPPVRATAPRDPRAEAARVRALAATKALRSYAFSSVASVGGDRTSVTGKATLPSDVTYVLTKGKSKQQVVRVAGTTYLRSLPGSWQRLRQAQKAGSPLAGLLSALNSAEALTLDASGRHLAGTIAPARAASAGLVKARLSTPVTVTFVLDGAGRVSAFDLRTDVHTAARTVPLTEHTSYDRFNRTPKVTAP